MSETRRIATGSIEWVDFPIETEADPTAFPVEVALVPTGTMPASDDSDYRVAAWVAGGGPDVWEVRLLIGSAGADTDYAVGVYDAYVRVTATPEVPVIPAGGLEVYGAEAPRIIDVQDLADFLQTTIPADNSGADFACDIGSAVVRAKLGQTVTFLADDSLVIEGSCEDRIRLPQRPVIEVDSVTVDGTLFPSAGYSLIGDELVLGVDSDTFASIASGLGSWGGARSRIVVVYSHGYAAVPADIRGLACSIAARVFQNPGGETSEGILSYSRSFSDPASFPLLPHEEAVVSRYRRRAGTLSTR